MLNSFRVVFVTLDQGEGGAVIPRCEYSQQGDENFYFIDWGYEPDNVANHTASWGPNYAYDPRTLKNIVDAYNGPFTGDDEQAYGGRHKKTLINACCMTGGNPTDPNYDLNNLFTRTTSLTGVDDLFIPSNRFSTNPGGFDSGNTFSIATQVETNVGQSTYGKYLKQLRIIDFCEDGGDSCTDSVNWPKVLYIGAIGAGGHGQGCLTISGQDNDECACSPCSDETNGTKGRICNADIFKYPYKRGGNGAEASMFLKLCGAIPDTDSNGNESRNQLTIITTLGRGGIDSWIPQDILSGGNTPSTSFPTGNTDTIVEVYEGEVDNWTDPPSAQRILKMTCPGGSNSPLETDESMLGDCNFDNLCGTVVGGGCGCLQSCATDGVSGANRTGDGNNPGSSILLEDTYFKTDNRGTWQAFHVSSDQPEQGVEAGRAINAALEDSGISNYANWYDTMQGWDTDTNINNLYQPGLGGNGYFKYWVNSDTPPIVTEGAGGNGGGVFFGFGPRIFTPAADSNEGEVPTTLKAGTGFNGRFIKPETDRTFTYTDPADTATPRKDALDYTPVGDSTAKGFDAAAIVRFTELPEITREGDFYITAQAYHMEGIEKLTFIMDGGTPIDVTEPIPHPNDLGTDYDNTPSELGAGYKEYMVRVDTATMDDGSVMPHDSVHEIRVIAWPVHGYPVVLQGERTRHVYRKEVNGSLTEIDGGVDNIILGQHVMGDTEFGQMNPADFPWNHNVYPPSHPNAGETILNENKWVAKLETINNEEVYNPIVANPYYDQPIWPQTSRDAILTGYYGFWFRYQKPGQEIAYDSYVSAEHGRRIAYVSQDNVDGQQTGTKEWPYRTVTEAISAEGSDLYAGKLYLEGGLHPYWERTPSAYFNNTDDVPSDGEDSVADQCPSCQVLTIEGDPDATSGCTLLPFSGRITDTNDPREPYFDSDSPKYMNAHYKNLDIPCGLTFQNNSNSNDTAVSYEEFFNITADKTDFGNSLFLENCLITSVGPAGANMAYVGYEGFLDDCAGKCSYRYTDLLDNCGCLEPETTHIIKARSRGTCSRCNWFSPSSCLNVNVGDTIRWEWERAVNWPGDDTGCQTGCQTVTSGEFGDADAGSLFNATLDSDNTSFEFLIPESLAGETINYFSAPQEGNMTGRVMVLSSPQNTSCTVSGMNMCNLNTNCLPPRDVGTLGPDNLIIPEMYGIAGGGVVLTNAGDELVGGHTSRYALKQRGVANDGALMLMATGCRLHALYSKRFDKPTLLKNNLEHLCQGDSAGHPGCIANCRWDIRNIPFTGKRAAVTSKNTKHADELQWVNSVFGCLDNRIYADMWTTNNHGQLFHMFCESPYWARPIQTQGVEGEQDYRTDLPYIGSREGDIRGNWRLQHSVKNLVFVGIKADSTPAMAIQGNINIQGLDHFILKNIRMPQARLNWYQLAGGGYTFSGEMFDGRCKHLLYDDVHTDKWVLFPRFYGNSTNMDDGVDSSNADQGYIKWGNDAAPDYLQSVPIYDNEGLSVLDGSVVTDWKTTGNGIDMSNSIINPDDNCLLTKTYTASGSFGPSGMRLWDSGDGDAYIPPQAVAYSIDQAPCMSAPQGLISDGMTELGDPLVIQPLKYLKTFIQGSASDWVMTSYEHGISGPIGTVATDVNNSYPKFGAFTPGAVGFSNEGDPIFAYFYYDRNNFYSAVANGGFDYTPPDRAP